jgi:hypothetical protein
LAKLKQKREKMNVILIDYSEIYYSTIMKTAVPDRLAGKFVQIRNSTTEYLVFAPKELAPYHADIVERFCSEKGLSGHYDSERKRFEIHDPGWVIAGGGKFETDKAEKRIRLYDNSMAYGRFDTEGLREKILSLEGMSDYRVQIG